MPDLPLILAGPILRRVTPRQVSVWIALSKEAEVKLSIWDQEINTGVGFEIFDEGSIPLKHTSTKRTARIGQNMHIVVIVINLEQPEGTPTIPSLVPGELYSYNLSFKIEGEPASDLKSNKLLIDSQSIENYYGIETDAQGKFFLKNGIRFNLQTEDGKAFFKEEETKIFLDELVNLPLGYIPGFLPSFVIPPPGLDKINLAHGSCRKVHGAGKDSLAALDFIIKKSVVDNSGKRPHQLYLTGDQIYADEVPVIILPYLNLLGSSLVGIQEKMNVKKKDGTTTELDASIQNFPAERRQKLVNEYGHFTSGSASNHLLSFGEFASAYIMYWCNSAWHIESFIAEADLKKREDYLAVWDVDPDPTKDLLDSVDETKKERTKQALKEKTKRSYKSQLPHFIEFRKKLPYVRRVLANVPVFMIMDDHEVTDDWYITKAWKNSVLTSPLGMNIIRNALMAYTLFQDLGNNPVEYEKADSAKKNLLEKIQQVFPDRSLMSDAARAVSEIQSANASNEISSLFGLDLNDETPPPVKWHYSVPCGEISIHVLDTRTRRTYETLNSSPGLLSRSAMDDQIPLDLQPDSLMIFVSPAPVLGLAVIEELVQPAAIIHNSFSPDPETWSFCPPVFENFLSRIQQFKKVLLLSGDVHFGMTLTLDYWKKGETIPARIIQLVSSALKNEEPSEFQFFSGALVQQLLGSLFYPIERIGYNSNASLQVTNSGNINNPPKLRIRLRKEPVLLPTQGWPKGSVVRRGSNPEPADWSWRVTALKDDRPDDNSAEARPAKIRIPSFDPDIDPVSPGDDAYNTLVLRHQETYRHSVVRRIVFNSNIGLINFKLEDDEAISVVHSFFCWLRSDEGLDEPDFYTVYISSLEASTDAEPIISPSSF